MNLNRIDLNLFAVFDAIYTAGSLTKAADVLCITQPAVSNSLARLREMLNDPLFVRTGHSMTPTPVAQNIIVPARQALHCCEKVCKKATPSTRLPQKNHLILPVAICWKLALCLGLSLAYKILRLI